MYRVSSISQYLNLIDDEIFELEEMAYCMGEDLEDELADFSPHRREIAEYQKTPHRKLNQAPMTGIPESLSICPWRVG